MQTGPRRAAKAAGGKAQQHLLARQHRHRLLPEIHASIATRGVAGDPQRPHAAPRPLIQAGTEPRPRQVEHPPAADLGRRCLETAVRDQVALRRDQHASQTPGHQRHQRPPPAATTTPPAARHL